MGNRLKGFLLMLVAGPIVHYAAFRMGYLAKDMPVSDFLRTDEIFFDVLFNLIAPMVPFVPAMVMIGLKKDMSKTWVISLALFLACMVLFEFYFYLDTWSCKGSLMGVGLILGPIFLSMIALVLLYLIHLAVGVMVTLWHWVFNI